MTRILSHVRKRKHTGSILLGLFVVLVALVGLGGSYWSAIVNEPGAHIQPTAIRAVIAQESPVLYRDGQHRIGVFFSREHREYVAFDEIPRSWVAAIIAAEDQRFWDHGGVDLAGITRAMWRNLRAGRMVAGGSTLTQQTAKNLFYRPDRTFRSKWTEFLNALRLEAHFTKKDILEFYANQFHVSSNGRGLGIAARYFFDKDVAALSTLECAFIAGMVKAPARYNPFIGKTDKERADAALRAQDRTRYVLARMLDEGFLTPTVHADLRDTPLPFEKGQFQYESNVLLDEVETRLGEAPFPEMFESLGIDNPSTAGISIVTTIDQQAQQSATYGLWHHLSEVGPLLEEGVSARLNKTQRGDSHARGDALVHHAFYKAMVRQQGDGFIAEVDGARCAVDEEALTRMATILARSTTGNRWTRASVGDLQALKKFLSAGKETLVSVRAAGDAPVCDLEIDTDLQGAVLLLEQGRIRAMVGGNDNRNFNRAITARRQLGSTWKPVLFHAALQLGWSPLDALDNRNNVFHFEGTWYYPRADHDSESWTSMAWAATRSENLGSIWLLAHLTERLGADQFQALAEQVGLTRKENEEWMEWIRRIRDDHGIISTRDRLPEAAFHAARAGTLEALPDGPERRELGSLFYGRGLEAERVRVDREGDEERKRKRGALRRSYRHLAHLGTTCLSAVQSLRDALDTARAETGMDIEEDLLSVAMEPVPGPDLAIFDGLRVRWEEPTWTLSCGPIEEDWTPIDEEGWTRLVHDESPLPSIHAIGVDGPVSLGTLTTLHGAMKRHLLVWEGADPYDAEVLRHHPDYRVLIGMAYLDHLGRELGVREPLPPVLSMPLGAADLSLEEAATLYQGLMDAQRWSFPGSVKGVRVPSPAHSTQLISEIRDRNGTLLYEAEPVPEPVADPVPGRLMGDMLRNVVRWGTGRRASGLSSETTGLIPVAGKTGTTNGYRNAAFAGFVPVASQTGWRWADGFTLVAYVGYDDNRSMRRNNTRLQGSNGALPAWITTVQGLADAGLLGQVKDGTPSALHVEEVFASVPVDEHGGMPVAILDEIPDRTVLVEAIRGADGQVTGVHRRFSPLGMPTPPGAPLSGPSKTAGPGDAELGELDPWTGDDTGVDPRIIPDIPPPTDP